MIGMHIVSCCLSIELDAMWAVENYILHGSILARNLEIMYHSISIYVCPFVDNTAPKSQRSSCVNDVRTHFRCHRWSVPLLWTLRTWEYCSTRCPSHCAAKIIWTFWTCDDFSTCCLRHDSDIHDLTELGTCVFFVMNGLSAAWARGQEARCIDALSIWCNIWWRGDRIGCLDGSFDGANHTSERPHFCSAAGIWTD